jgi:hypothetical protein
MFGGTSTRAGTRSEHGAVEKDEVRYHVGQNKICYYLSMQKPPEIEAAHGHCAKHRQEILASKICGCFYCLELF